MTNLPPERHHPDCDFRNSSFAKESAEATGVDVAENAEVFACNLDCGSDDESIDTFCQRLGLTLTVERVGEPLLNVTPTNRPYAFRCKSCMGTIDLDTGRGLERGPERYPSTRGYQCARCGALQAKGDTVLRYRVTLGREGSSVTHSSDYTQGSAFLLTGPPTVADVVTAFRSDANCYRGSDTADDFIRELGYLDGDGDALENVRRGEADYLACGRTFRALTDLLGMAEAGHLLDVIEED